MMTTPIHRNDDLKIDLSSEDAIDQPRPPALLFGRRRRNEIDVSLYLRLQLAIIEFIFQNERRVGPASSARVTVRRHDSTGFQNVDDGARAVLRETARL